MYGPSGVSGPSVRQPFASVGAQSFTLLTYHVPLWSPERNHILDNETKTLLKLQGKAGPISVAPVAASGPSNPLSPSKKAASAYNLLATLPTDVPSTAGAFKATYLAEAPGVPRSAVAAFTDVEEGEEDIAIGGAGEGSTAEYVLSTLTRSSLYSQI
jgi:hypothetical protein